MKTEKIGSHFATVAEGIGEPGEIIVYVTRTSLLTNRVHTIPLRGVGYYSVVQWMKDRRERRASLVQDAFPNLTSDEREFLMTGITADEWRVHVWSPENE